MDMTISITPGNFFPLIWLLSPFNSHRSLLSNQPTLVPCIHSSSAPPQISFKWEHTVCLLLDR